MTAPETRWTAETEELVAGKLPAVEIPCPDPQCGDSTWDHECELGATGPNLGATRRILAALADARLLLPAAGTECTSYGHLSPAKSYVYECDIAEAHSPDCEHRVSHTARVFDYPDGSRYYGAWIEVPS